MTDNQPQRPFWQSPWGYAHSMVVVAGLLIVGTFLQILAGSFNYYLLAYPINLGLGIIILAICLVAGWRYRGSWLVRWLSGRAMSVCLIVALMLLALLMGLIPQLSGEQPVRTWLGWEGMTRNWGFVLIYLFTLLSLGMLIVRRLVAFRWGDYAFLLNHAGLWLLLMASGLGYADMERYVMHVREGETEWRVYDDAQQVKELPIAIELKDFDMDVYPPSLALVDRQSGEVQPVGAPQYLPIDADQPKGTLGLYEIEVEKYIHEAIRNSDSTYHHVPMPGAAPAALVRVVCDGQMTEGWVCAGNSAQLHRSLPIDGRLSLVMTPPEPRSFTSDVVVYTQGGVTEKALLRVNHPLSVRSWTIYQYGYDNQAGRLSSYSSFELVYDPWLWPVYAGIVMMMAGSVTLLWHGRKRKEQEYVVE